MTADTVWPVSTHPCHHILPAFKHHSLRSMNWNATPWSFFCWAFFRRNQKSNTIVFWARVSSCSLGWSGTYYVVQAGFEHMADFLHQSCECWCCRCEPSCMTLAQISAHRNPHPEVLIPITIYWSVWYFVKSFIYFSPITYYIITPTSELRAEAQGRWGNKPKTMELVQGKNQGNQHGEPTKFKALSVKRQVMEVSGCILRLDMGND